MPLSDVSEMSFVRILRHSGQVGQIAFPWSEHDTPRFPRRFSAGWEIPLTPPTLMTVQTEADQLVGVEKFHPPFWEVLADNQRPPRRDPAGIFSTGGSMKLLQSSGTSEQRSPFAEIQ